MANGLQHPSVYDKIHEQSYLMSTLSYDMLKNRKHVINTSGVQHPHLHLKWRSRLPPCIQGPREKGNPNHGPLRPVYAFMAGVGSEIVAAPFNRVKFLIQNQNEMLKKGRLFEPYRGSDECFARTIRVEGYLSLWRGNTANIIGYVTTEALEASLNNYFTRPFLNLKRKEAKSIISYCKFFAWKVAATSAESISALLFVYPLDYAHTRLANDIKATRYFDFSLDTANKKAGIGYKYRRQFNGLVDVYKKTIQSDGIAGLYRGFSVCCLGTIVYTGLDALPKFSLALILPFRTQDKPYTSLMIAYGSAAAAGLAYHPFDTLRRRMMMTSGEAIKYNNSWDALAQIIEKEGAKSLFKGVGATFLHSLARTLVLFSYVAMTHHKENRS